MHEPLKNCPFCGGDARHDAHADDCYFILHRKFKNSGADMSPAFEVLAAWNRRTPQPTQAQAGAVPLTVSQIREWWESETGIEDCDMCRITDFLRVVRAVEERHGIKGGQHGADAIRKLKEDTQ